MWNTCQVQGTHLTTGILGQTHRNEHVSMSTCTGIISTLDLDVLWSSRIWLASILFSCHPTTNKRKDHSFFSIQFSVSLSSFLSLCFISSIKSILHINARPVKGRNSRPSLTVRTLPPFTRAAHIDRLSMDGGGGANWNAKGIINNYMKNKFWYF